MVGSKRELVFLALLAAALVAVAVVTSKPKAKPATLYLGPLTTTQRPAPADSARRWVEVDAWWSAPARPTTTAPAATTIPTSVTTTTVATPAPPAPATPPAAAAQLAALPPPAAAPAAAATAQPAPEPTVQPDPTPLVPTPQAPPTTLPLPAPITVPLLDEIVDRDVPLAIELNSPSPPIEAPALPLDNGRSD
jgi:hypothetical protein